MENINLNSNTEVQGPAELLKAEQKKSYKDKLKAKEIFETEIVAGRIYFDYNNQKYYIRKATRKDGNDIITFREIKKYEYLVYLASQSEMEKHIRENIDSYPPVCYKVKKIKQGQKTIRDVEYLTKEEEEKVINCYRQKIYDIDTIKSELGLSKNIELQISPCASAVDLLQNTAEMRATADANEWSLMSRVCYVTGENKDKPVFATYEDFINSEDGIDMTTEVAKAIEKAEKDSKKK